MKREEQMKSGVFLVIALSLFLSITCISIQANATSSFSSNGDGNDCPATSYNCDETPGVLEYAYLEDGIYFVETNDIFPPVGMLTAGTDIVKLGILANEDGEEIKWSELSQDQQERLEEEHGVYATPFGRDE